MPLLLLPRRLAVLVELDKAITLSGFSPTLRELAAAADVSVASVNEHVVALFDAGLVTYEPNKARTLRLTRLGKRVVDEHLAKLAHAPTEA